MSNFTKCVSSGAHNIVFSLLCKLVGTIPQVWEQSQPFLRWHVNLLWEQTQEGGNFLRACELTDTTVPLYYDDDDDDDDDTKFSNLPYAPRPADIPNIKPLCQHDPQHAHRLRRPTFRGRRCTFRHRHRTRRTSSCGLKLPCARRSTNPGAGHHSWATGPTISPTVQMLSDGMRVRLGLYLDPTVGHKMLQGV